MVALWKLFYLSFKLQIHEIDNTSRTRPVEEKKKIAVFRRRRRDLKSFRSQDPGDSEVHKYLVIPVYPPFLVFTHHWQRVEK